MQRKRPISKAEKRYRITAEDGVGVAAEDSSEKTAEKRGISTAMKRYRSTAEEGVGVMAEKRGRRTAEEGIYRSNKREE